MDAPIAPTNGHVYQEHSPVADEEEHHEKKPVLKMVKDRVKKIKNTINKKRHGHDDVHDADDHDVHEEEEEGSEENEQEMEVDPPTHESAAAPNVAGDTIQREESHGKKDDGKYYSAKERVNLGNVINAENPAAPKPTPEPFTAGHDDIQSTDKLGDSLDAMSISERLENEQGPSPPTHDDRSASPEKTRLGPDQEEEETPPTSYTEKIISTASAAKDAAVTAAKDAAVKEKTRSGPEGENKPPTSYTEKITYTASAAAAAAVAAASTVYGKVAGTGTVETGKVQPSSGKEGTDKQVSVREYLAEKLTPGEEDRALSEVLSETMHKKPEKEEEKSREDRERTAESGGGKGMTERIRGAVTSMFGGGGSGAGVPPAAGDAVSVTGGGVGDRKESHKEGIEA